MPENTSQDAKSTSQADSRRSFLAIATGALAVLAPIGAGIVSFLSPLFRKSESPEVRVALLSQVPEDGKPHFFSVVANREDAWNRYPNQKIGAVYLIRQPGERIPTAFTAKCPHAGCSIGYAPAEEQFKCPCHTSTFHLDGSRVHGDDEVAPRDMDTLEVTLNEVEVENGVPVTEVLVKFVDFQTGHKEKKPVA